MIIDRMDKVGLYGKKQRKRPTGSRRRKSMHLSMETYAQTTPEHLFDYLETEGRTEAVGSPVESDHVQIYSGNR